MQLSEHSSVNLRALRTFVAVVDSGGLGRASERLHVSQPAASRQIDALEAQFGVPLFQRVGRQLQLTSEGEDLLRQSRRLLADTELLVERARALKSGQAGTLRVAAAPQNISSLLAPFLPRYRDQYPGIDVRIIEGSAMLQRSRLERGEVHVAIMAARDGRFAQRLLGPLHALAVLPKKHRLGRRAVIEITELAEEPLLLMQREYAVREWFDAACETAHLLPRVLMEGTNAFTLIELAAVGYGVAVVSSSSLMRNPELRAAVLVNRGAPIGRWTTVSWDPQRLMPPYGQRFIDELVAYSRHSFPGRNLIRRAPPLPKPKLPQS
jgi:LysR family transcriptional regulator, cyn operon transcriptional activator